MNRSSLLSLLAALALVCSPALAAVPQPVSGLAWSDTETLIWDAEPSSDDYNVYRGSLAEIRGSGAGACHGDEVVDPSFDAYEAPGAGDGFFYLVSGESDLDGEGPLGAGREPQGRCDQVVRHHALSRLAFGHDPWTEDRLDALGLDAFVDEQLDPASIAESDNAALNNRLARLTPAENLNMLVQAQLVRGIYARRQLEQQLTVFWNNHFNTDWNETAGFLFVYYQPQLDQNFPYRWFLNTTKLHEREIETFRDIAFGGTFRELVETSALAPAMLIYLDTIENLKAAPNENYARELLELHTMGVDNGYTQADVEELARVMSGWTVCMKAQASIDDPLAPCLDPFFGPKGPWTAHFNPDEHDTGQKVLFAGTPHEAVIPDTAGNVLGGVDDLGLALDAIVAHPSTARFISTKLIEAFVSEDPSEAMIDDVVAAWDASGGDLVSVYRAVFELPEAFDPRSIGGKIKTPYEHIVSAYRALEGTTDYIVEPLIENYLYTLQYLMFRNPVPTGYPERGRPWINTNSLLDRQKLGIDIATNFLYGTNPAGLVNAAGLSEPDEIVAFLADRLVGGRLAPGQLARAEWILTTDDEGNPAPTITAGRVNDTAAYILGLANFLEQ